MKKEIKILSAGLIFVISFFAFNLLEFELLNEGAGRYFQSFIFSSTLILSLFMKSSRKKLIYGAFCMIIAMAGLFLAGNIPLSNFTGTIGIGALFIIIFSFLPEIIKRGFVEKL